MADIEIARALTTTEGRYVGRIEGVEDEAELTFSRAGDMLVIADHTFAPNSMRGKGAAIALINRLITDGRTAGFKIVPLCPCVKAQYLRRPECADVVKA